ncbi:MAG TPA: hypothetical protein VK307_06700 [Thermoleophilaceae bacterium]|nr:hypothetical protein [Thermoleophilaceae bacterium]
MGNGLRAAALAAGLAGLAIPTSAAARGDKPDRRCDFIDPHVCLYPWPNDLFTKRDRSTATGRRLALPRASMPRNKDGRPIDATDINRGDGFSPGSMILVKVPGVETPEAVRRSKLPPLTNLRASLRRNSPVVVVNARTRKRHPVWAEIDSNAERPRDRSLIIRPARNFDEGERYIVALRDLKNSRGTEIAASRGFRLYRDRRPTANRLVESRRRKFESIFRTLRRAGVARRDLYLAWDFTVASSDSLAGRMLHIRDDAFRLLGDRNLRDLEVAGSSPEFRIDKVTDFTPSQDDRIARTVDGTLTLPCYITNGCAPGGSFRLDRRGNPRRLGTTTAPFVCNIPRSVLDPASPPQARLSLYGHGLLGRATEVNQGQLKSFANEHDFVFCATPWAGFAADDLPHIVSVTSDFSRFNTVADRMQQGFLNMLMLGRAMIHPQGLSSHPAFQKNGRGVIDTRRLFFDGNSQGGVMGGALAAVAPDFERAALGVPGMNYSTLLQRSVDFDAYGQLIYPAYPRVLERQLMFAAIQLLWDRGEADGYAHHMTRDPLPNTPRHELLMHVAFGDHQVSDVTAEVEARTIGASGVFPPVGSGRSSWARFQLIPRIPSFPYAGSAIVMWDSGTPEAPLTNTPNRAGEDPHEFPRRQAAARLQKSEFLRIDGRLVDVCGGGACLAPPSP